MDEKEKEETKVGAPRGRKKKPKVNFGYEEMQEKLARIFNALGYFLKIDVEYNNTDFEEESKDLIRLAEKYPILANVLTFLDPLFLILGLFSKMRIMLDKVKERKEKQKEEVKEIKEVVSNGNNYTT